MRKPELLLAAPFSAEEMEALARDYSVHVPWAQDDPAAYLTSVAGQIRGIATTGAAGADSDLMSRLPNLEIVATFGVGLDAVDLEYARRRGIRVAYTPDVLTDDVADMGMALLLAVTRAIPTGDFWVRQGRWPQGPMPLGSSLRGKTCGILGLGRIGSAVARRAEAFGMNILYSGRSGRPEATYPYRPSPAALAKDSDVLMICAAGGQETRGLVGAETLDALGPDGFLVNIARGSLVEEPALIKSLKERKIAGAGLDVFYDEPRINPAFFDLPNVVLQPHNGSGTIETRRAIGKLMRDNLAAHFAGRPLPTPVL